MYEDTYTLLGLYALGALLFLGLAFTVARLLRPSAGHSLADPRQGTPYECGEAPVGGGGMLRFSLRYYLYALLFVLFEVELLVVLPWARIMGTLEELHGAVWLWVAFVEMSFFIGLLLLGWFYAWRHGGLQHLFLVPQAPVTPASAVPAARYEAFNARYAGRQALTPDEKTSQPQ